MKRASSGYLHVLPYHRVQFVYIRLLVVFVMSANIYHYWTVMLILQFNIIREIFFFLRINMPIFKIRGVISTTI